MAAPLHVLFLPELDADHERLELMLDEAQNLDGVALERCFDALLAETAAHFAREEAFFAQGGTKNLLCHRARHQALLALGADLRRKFGDEGDSTRRTRLIVEDFARALADHVLAMDRISADQFLTQADASAVG